MSDEYSKCAWCEKTIDGFRLVGEAPNINGPYCSAECTSQWMLGQMSDKDDRIKELEAELQSRLDYSKKQMADFAKLNNENNALKAKIKELEARMVP